MDGGEMHAMVLHDVTRLDVLVEELNSLDLPWNREYRESRLLMKRSQPVPFPPAFQAIPVMLF